MGQATGISWTDATFNPWIGCAKVAPGCEHCYAEAFAKRYGKAQWGPNGTRVKTSEAYWREPVKWNRDAERDGMRRRVFCASLADVFEEIGSDHVFDHKGNTIYRSFSEVTRPSNDPADHYRVGLDHLRRDLFALIDQTPHLDWLLLTKRPENVPRMWCSHANTDGLPPSKLHRDNVWLGTSVSDQATADRNVPLLVACRDLCPVLFLSCEPLLGPVHLTDWLACYQPDVARKCGEERFLGSARPNSVDWVIVGGESGPRHRPMDHAWARLIRDQCRAAGLPFFFKQSSGLRSGSGIELDGEVIQEFPRCDQAPSGE